jgi:hypothetical protein
VEALLPIGKALPNWNPAAKEIRLGTLTQQTARKKDAPAVVESTEVNRGCDPELFSAPEQLLLASEAVRV